MSIILRRTSPGRNLVPYYRPSSVFDRMDTLARGIWENWRPFMLDTSFTPTTDIFEEEGELVVKTELPGIEKEGLDITLEGDRLTIKAEKKEEVKEGTTEHVRERYHGQYYRSWKLPYPVKEEEVSASFDNGVLELRLPKTEEDRVKKIEVKANLLDGETKKRGRKKKKES